jgi:hypothetical protein
MTFPERVLLAAAQKAKGIEAADQTLAYMDLREMAYLCQWLGGENDRWLKLIGAEDYKWFCNVALSGGHPTGNAAATPEQLLKAAAELRRADRALRRRDGEQVLRVLTAAEATGASGPAMNLHRAAALLVLGRADEAWEQMDALVKAFPEHDEYQYDYAILLLEAGRHADALARLEAMGPRARATGEAQFARACCIAGDGRVDEAWAVLGPLARANPAEVLGPLRGDAPHLQALRAHKAYRELLSAAAAAVSGSAMEGSSPGRQVR